MQLFSKVIIYEECLFCTLARNLYLQYMEKKVF